MQLPTLYKKQKSGKISEWTIMVETGEDGFPVIVRTSGFTDGKKTVTKKVVKKGTNKGKANERTPLEQAETMAQSMWNKQKDDNYFENLEDATDESKVSLYPMLAQPYEEARVKFPCIVQPKFNGVRCTQYMHIGDHRLLSRKGKEFTVLKFMKNEIEKIFGEYSPDGEIYIHQVPLQDIISKLKREQADSQNLRFVVYDLAIPNMLYNERRKLLDKLFREYKERMGSSKYVRLSPVSFATEASDIEHLHQYYVELGYEGIIIRNPLAEYHFNERSYDLMKYKNFKDKEFPIVGFEAERYYDKQNDEYKDIVIWHCLADNGKKFNVRPVGSVEKKAFLYNKGNEYIGKKLTVKYLELSNEGIPIGNPVGSFATPAGEAIRDYE